MSTRIAILFPSFFGGGAEQVCAWMLEALQESYSLSLISLAPVTLQELDEQYGTTLKEGRISVIDLLDSRFWQKLVVNASSHYSLRQYLMSHLFRKIATTFNLAISAFNEMDLGEAGIQYIHAPLFGVGSEEARIILGFDETVFKRLYRKALMVVFGFSGKRMKRNLSIANSRWTAQLLRHVYGIDSSVIYPPVVVDERKKREWEQREEGFVLVSRAVPEKKIERAIQILHRVREEGFDVHLHIVGGVGDIHYGLKLQEETRDLGWVIWEKRMFRQQYLELLGSHKYGIHARENEQFGIGVAEMVAMGCIVFAPRNGGQSEVLGGRGDLLWKNEVEAVEKMAVVLGTSGKAENIVRELEADAAAFSAEQFCQSLREVVKHVLGDGG